MKTNLAIFVTAASLCSMASDLKSQNTFPDVGNAGIGTTTPAANLEIKATQAGALLIGPYGPSPGKTGELRFQELAANGSNFAGFKSPDLLSGNLIWVLPDVIGTNGQVLSTDGTGKLIWKSAQSGANASLSNLSSTKINQSLLPKTNNSYHLGSGEKAWANLYLSGQIYTEQARIFSLEGNHNTMIGMNAGADNTGADNTFVGEKAGSKNTTGGFNDGFGSFALFSNTSGADNAAFGSNALYSNTTGFSNVASGYATLHANTSGNNNSAFGVQAMYSNTTGFANVSIGGSSLYYNVSGSNNVAVGYQALFFNEGSSNTATGFKALLSNTIGTNNAAFGGQALYTNSTGQNNVAVGYQALYTCNNSYNTACGYQSLYFNTGNQNTAVGYQALYSNTTGDYNTADGYGAGSLNDNSSYCSFFGYDADQSGAADYSNATAVGWSSRITASDQVRIGNSVVTSIGGYTNWSNVSDGRFKTGIEENVPGMAFINKLRPVTYQLDAEALHQFLNEGEGDAASKQAREAKSEVTYTGFIAQEVEDAAKSLGYQFSGVDAPKNENDLYALRYAEFVVPLTKAVQELSGENEKLHAELNELKNVIAQAQSEMDALRLQIQNLAESKTEPTPGSDRGAGNFLGQNIPNPSGGSSVVPYHIAVDCRSAKLVIAETSSGRVVETIALDVRQESIVINTGKLLPGAYSYSLYLDEKFFAAKQMVVSH